LPVNNGRNGFREIGPKEEHASDAIAEAEFEALLAGSLTPVAAAVKSEPRPSEAKKRPKSSGDGPPKKKLKLKAMALASDTRDRFCKTPISAENFSEKFSFTKFVHIS
jgi:hypothetical protein